MSGRRLIAPTLLIGIPICVALIANTVPYFNGNSIAERELVYNAAQRWQIVAFLGLLSAPIIGLLLGRFSLGQSISLSLLYGPFALYLFVNTLQSDIPDVSLLYAAIFLVVAITLTGIRLAAEEWLTVLARASIVMLGMVVVFCSIKHLDIGNRAYGAVHPNLFGSWVGVTAVLCSTWKSRLRWLAVLSMLALAIVIDSRFATLFIVMFSFSTIALQYRNSSRKLFNFIVAVGLLACVAGGMATQFIEGSGVRSLGGGISGREGRWELGMQRIEKSPILGNGFRSSHQRSVLYSIQTAHSGALTLWEELGLIGFLLFFGMLAGRIASLFRVLRQQRNPAVEKLTIVCLSALAAYLSPLLFQPNYLNFGDPLGILVLLSLFVKIYYPSLKSVPQAQPRLQPTTDMGGPAAGGLKAVRMRH